MRTGTKNIKISHWCKIYILSGVGLLRCVFLVNLTKKSRHFSGAWKSTLYCNRWQEYIEELENISCVGTGNHTNVSNAVEFG